MDEVQGTFSNLQPQMLEGMCIMRNASCRAPSAGSRKWVLRADTESRCESEAGEWCRHAI